MQEGAAVTDSEGKALQPGAIGEGTQDTATEPLFPGNGFNASTGRMDLHTLLESVHRISGPLYKTAEQVVTSA